VVLTLFEKTNPMLKWEKWHKIINSNDLWRYLGFFAVFDGEKQSQSKPILFSPQHSWGL
jgi:hypothetical protein